MVTLSLKKGQAGWESFSLGKDESPTNKFILCLDFSDQLTNVENFQLYYESNIKNWAHARGWKQAK